MAEWRLTKRELEVLRLMPDHNSGDIARKLGIAKSTVYQYQHSIRKKFGLVGRGRLRTVLKAIEIGFIDL